MRPSLSLGFACIAGVLALAANVEAGKGGTLDPSFGFGGFAIATFAHPTHAAALAIQPDGRVLAAGYGGASAAFGVVRLDANGMLDPTFGVGGQVTTQVARDVGAAVALQPDGRIIVAGTSSAPGPGSVGRVMLVRYEATGSLDTTFGTGGISLTTPVSTAEVRGAALQADGRLVVVGQDAGAFMVRRYEADGSVDGTFGTGGVTITPIGPTSSGAAAVLMEPSGAIVVAGSAKNAFGDDDFALARYATDGTLDGTFGTGGIVQTAVGIGYDDAAAIARDASGRILVAGYSTQSGPGGGTLIPTLVRYLPSGTSMRALGAAGSLRTR